MFDEMRAVLDEIRVVSLVVSVFLLRFCQVGLSLFLTAEAGIRSKAAEKESAAWKRCPRRIEWSGSTLCFCSVYVLCLFWIFCCWQGLGSKHSVNVSGSTLLPDGGHCVGSV